MTTAAPTVVGHYVIERELGRGAFGAVYKAHHRDRPDWPVALKVIEARGDLDKLMAEPALLGLVKHPCVVGVEDYFAHNGRLAIALEYVHGEDLKACLDRGDEFSPEQVRTLLIQLGGALAAAHARQVVHRDIKPANILVDRSGGSVRFVLTDFGIGRRQEGLQAEKHAGGTYHFMAPEQLRGRPAPQSDLWALGVVAYRLLTGRLPFPGPSLPELARQIQYVLPPPPSEVRGAPLPHDLEAAVMRLLDKSLSERTASAEQLLHELGYEGDSQKVTQAPARTSRDTRSREPLQQKLSRAVRNNRWKLVACVVVYLIPSGIVRGTLYLAGIALFFNAQSGARRRGQAVGLTVASFAVLLGANSWATLGLPDTAWDVQSWTTRAWMADGPPPPQPVATQPGAPPAPRPRPPSPNPVWALAALGVMVVMLCLQVLACTYYANLRRAQREQTLWDAARAGEAGAEQFLATLRAMVDTRIEDVGLHLRYAEMLFARGDHRSAAVEARLLLEQDPYHFNGNLLLANASAALGLWEDCLKVCEEYLQVAGYCFEFEELRQQSLRRLDRA